MRMLRHLEPVQTAVADAPQPEASASIMDRLPLAVFLFLYLPMTYWSGLALKAGYMMDYPSFYLAARLAFVDGISPYGYDAFDDFSASMDRWLPPFVYPPPSLLAFWPLTPFSLQTAFVLFTVFSHLCLLGSIWLILNRLIPLPEQRWLKNLVLTLSVGYILISDAVPATLNLGQINIITVFFICLALSALVANRSDWRVAWPLSAAILLKTYPVLLLVLLVARRRFRAALLTVGCYGVYVAISAWMLPKVVWTSFVREVLPAAVVSRDQVLLFSHSNVSFVWNQSIRGFLTRLLGDNFETRAPLFHPGLATPLSHAAAVLMISVTAFFAYRAVGRRIGTEVLLDDLAAFLLMVYLVAPVSWDHHLVFVLPPAVLALTLIVNGSVRGKTAVVLTVALFMIAWRMNLDAPMLKKYWWSLLASFKFFSVLALWAFFIRRLAQTGSPAAPGEPALQ